MDRVEESVDRTVHEPGAGLTHTVLSNTTSGAIAHSGGLTVADARMVVHT